MPTPPPDKRLPPGIVTVGWTSWGTTFGWCPVCGLKPHFTFDAACFGCRLEPHGATHTTGTGALNQWVQCPGSRFVVPYTTDVCRACNMPCSVPEQFCRVHGRCVECCTCDESAAACQRFVVDRWRHGYDERFRADRTPVERIESAYRHAYDDEFAQARTTKAYEHTRDRLYPAGHERLYDAQYGFLFDYDTTHDPE